MKTRMILATALVLFGLGQAVAQENKPSQVNAVCCSGSGNVRIVQSQDQLLVLRNGNPVSDYRVERGVLVLDGSSSYDVTVTQLDKIRMLSSGNVKGISTLKGGNLEVEVLGSGDLRMNVDYDTIRLNMKGSGDVTISGQCKVLYADMTGSGDLDAQELRVLEPVINSTGSGEPKMSDPVTLAELMAELETNLKRLSDSIDWENIEKDIEQSAKTIEDWGKDMEVWGHKMEEWGKHIEDKYGKYEYQNDSQQKPSEPEPKKDEAKEERPVKKTLLFDSHWAGFDAGLNMLINQTPTNMHNQEPVPNLGVRPMRSWQFALNVIDVGIAFDKRHIAGLFTGVGISWNNFSWNNNIAVVYNTQNTLNLIEPTDPNRVVKNTKYGALYVQVPLMFEVRPTRRMYIDAGVTGGLRFAQWNRVKYADGTRLKYYHSSNLNLLKLDASLRVGGKNLGFFANYALLPMFTFDNAKMHPISFGVNLVF